MKNNDKEITWYFFDAKDQILGRLATQIANSLRGKKEVAFENNALPSNKVVVVNCEQIKVTGKKEEGKRYYHHSGYHGGLKEISLKDQRVKDATLILKNAVKGMLPKNKLITIALKNLYLYNGPEHPHTSVKFVNK
jgi:large subunit ribosomal protein L13